MKVTSQLIKMKAQVLSIEGKKIKDIELPKAFSEKIREDLIAKVLEAKKIKQPYSPNPMAGNQHSAAGILSHRRHVWKSDRGKGISRVPRKIFSRRGSQFNWEAATIPSAKGGRRAHPPKILHMLTRKKINKKEMNLALKSSLAATANEKMVSEKYSTLRNEKIKNLPIVIESGFLTLKTKEILNAMKNILGEKIFSVAIRKKAVRSGRGKLRGRKYKKNMGLLLVLGKNEKVKSKIFEVANTENLSVVHLAKGGLGRLVVYTEDAIKNLSEKLK